MLGAMADVTERVEAEAAIRRLNVDLEQRVRERTAELAARVAEVEQLNHEQSELMGSLKTSEQAAARSAARLQDANANLLTANQELEAFSYSISHDLRAPLRNITGFVDLLAKRAGGQLDGESTRFVSTVSAEATRMGMLIDDLLTFSRIGRAEMKVEPVGLDDLVADVCEELKTECADRAIAWKFGLLPRVNGDRTLLRQVLVNLLSNALKFTRQRPDAAIEFTANTVRPGEPMVTFSVRDNGVGFNPKYIEKLFHVFQRLHHSRDFEGTGIGLANVKRIVHRHGGRVWAEGAVGQGATFCFTLQPATDA
jgi:light-regulated signal transduction histidine kinase (bacteriophytochrome)